MKRVRYLFFFFFNVQYRNEWQCSSYLSGKPSRTSLTDSRVNYIDCVMNLWFTFLLFDFGLNGARFFRHSYSLVNRSQKIRFIIFEMVERFSVKNRHIYTKDSMHSNYFVTFYSSLDVCVCVFILFRIFCKVKWLTYHYLSDFFLLTLFCFLFLFHRFATDLVCTMRFLFRTVFVCVTAIGFVSWGCLKHMDHR